LVQRVRKRRAFPELHVVVLVAARNEQGFGATYPLQDERVACRVAARYDDGFDRTHAAHGENVRVVGFRSSGADHHEVAAAFSDHPPERIVDVRAAAHQH
jgi:hypothetical protein